jgi:hypothetical protein
MDIIREDIIDEYVKNPVRVEELEPYINLETSFFILTGKDSPIEDTDEDLGVTVSTILGSMIKYDSKNRHLTTVYSMKIEAIEGGRDYEQYSGGVDLVLIDSRESLLEKLRTRLQEVEWLPDPNLLSTVMKARGTDWGEIGPEFVALLEYPNEAAVDIMLSNI